MRTVAEPDTSTSLSVTEAEVLAEILKEGIKNLKSKEIRDSESMP